MSYKVSTRNNNNNNNDKRITREAPQPFCKVCFDAKRNDYNTHFLKDFSGPQPVVLCPYLLALKCNYCKEEGHTVSYCDILKAKKASEASPSSSSVSNTSSKSAQSQNGHFFIMRVSNNEVQSISNHSSSRKTAIASSGRAHSVSTTNHFALLEEEDEDVWEQPKYNKGKKGVISFATEQAVAAEPEPVVDLAPSGPSWAKIVAMAPVKKQVVPVSAKEVLKKEIQSLFVSTSSEAAAFERPMPTFIHPNPAPTPTSTDNSINEKKSINKLFFTAPSNRDWADDSSEDDGW